jgi:pimeloyl-ACP methyl ester carboxylesterase
MKTIRILGFITLTLLSQTAQAQIDGSIEIAPKGEHNGGVLQILYSDKNQVRNGKFVRPLIIAEGYDAWKILGSEDVNLYTIQRDYSSFINNLQRGYDIIYLNYGDGVGDILHNATLLEEAIDTVNARNDSYRLTGQLEKNVVMGISMGGLVARYCLASMEQKGKDHQTRKFISVDAPHKGANVPVGIQALVRDFYGLSVTFLGVPIYQLKDEPQLQIAWKLLNSEATKQLLIYYVNPSLSINTAYHAAFMQEYERVGFPQLCLNVAAANGNGFGQRLLGEGQTLFSQNKSQMMLKTSCVCNRLLFLPQKVCNFAA